MKPAQRFAVGDEAVWTGKFNSIDTPGQVPYCSQDYPRIVRIVDVCDRTDPTHGARYDCETPGGQSWFLWDSELTEQEVTK